MARWAFDIGGRRVTVDVNRVPDPVEEKRLAEHRALKMYKTRCLQREGSPYVTLPYDPKAKPKLLGKTQ